MNDLVKIKWWTWYSLVLSANGLAKDNIDSSFVEGRRCPLRVCGSIRFFASSSCILPMPMADLKMLLLFHRFYLPNNLQLNCLLLFADWIFYQCCY